MGLLAWSLFIVPCLHACSIACLNDYELGIVSLIFTKLCCVIICFAGGKSGVKRGFVPSTTAACDSALVQSETFLPQIVDGCVTVGQIKTAWKNFPNVQRLAIVIESKKEKSKEKKVKGKLTLSEEICRTLPQWWKEIQEFEMNFEHLYHLCQVIPPQICG